LTLRYKGYLRFTNLVFIILFLDKISILTSSNKSSERLSFVKYCTSSVKVPCNATVNTNSMSSYVSTTVLAFRTLSTIIQLGRAMFVVLTTSSNTFTTIRVRHK